MTTLPGMAQEHASGPPPAREGRSDTGAVLTAGDLWGMLKRRLVLIVFLSVFFTSLTVGGFLLCWFKFPGYRSESLIECISNIARAELTPEQQRLRQDEYERFVQTQAQLIKSPIILAEALKLTSVRNTQWWKDVNARRWKRPNEHHLDLLKELLAGPVRGTNFLRVSMVCKNPKDPAVIVRAVVNLWHDEVKRSSADEFADSPLNAARTELEALEREILDSRMRLRALAERLPAGAVQDPTGNITSLQVAQLAKQKVQLQLELAQLEQFKNFYNDPFGVSATAEDRAWVELDPEVQGARQGLFLLRQQFAADQKVYGSGHRILKQLAAQIDARESELTRLRAKRLQERRSDAREAANTAYDNTRHSLILTQEKLAKALGKG